MFDNFFRWFLLACVGFLLLGAMSLHANASCQMTTVIDPNTGQVKLCTQCCENGMCSVVCN